jgi:hypothetical protein
MEDALASRRRTGTLMCRHRLADDRAIAILKTHSQHRNVKVRELAETVIRTGEL